MPSPHPFRRRSFRRGAVAVSLVALAFSSACSGQRPTLTSQAGTSQTVASGETDDPVADLLRSTPSPFTARYTIQSTAAGSEPADAEVIVDGNRRRVSVRGVEFYVTATEELTCTPDGCVDGLQQGLISDLSIAEGFWGPSSATRLVGDIARRIGSLTHYDADVLGSSASCVDVPLAGPAADGTVTYCALTAGVLSSYSGADTTITMTGFEAEVDASQLVPPQTSG